MTEGIITLCGSTRFREQFDDANFWLTINGYIVLSPAAFLHSTSDQKIRDIINESKDNLDVLHREKIDMSRAIMVIDVDGYIGDSTKSEIIHAFKKDKTIYSYTLSKREDPKLKYLVGVAPMAIISWLDRTKKIVRRKKQDKKKIITEAYERSEWSDDEYGKGHHYIKLEDLCRIMDVDMYEVLKINLIEKEQEQQDKK